MIKVLDINPTQTYLTNRNNGSIDTDDRQQIVQTINNHCGHAFLESVATSETPPYVIETSEVSWSEQYLKSSTTTLAFTQSETLSASDCPLVVNFLSVQLSSSMPATSRSRTPVRLAASNALMRASRRLTPYAALPAKHTGAGASPLPVQLAAVADQQRSVFIAHRYSCCPVPGMIFSHSLQLVSLVQKAGSVCEVREAQQSQRVNGGCATGVQPGQQSKQNTGVPCAPPAHLVQFGTGQVGMVVQLLLGGGTKAGGGLRV